MNVCGVCSEGLVTEDGQKGGWEDEVREWERVQDEEKECRDGDQDEQQDNSAGDLCSVYATGWSGETDEKRSGGYRPDLEV